MNPFMNAGQIEHAPVPAAFDDDDDLATFKKRFAEQKLRFETALARRDLELRRCRAEIECLRIIKQRFECIVENVPSFLYASDGSGAITFMSNSFTAFTGSPASEALGSGWMKFVHTEDAAAVRDSLTLALRTGIARGMPLRICSAAGEYRRFLALGSPVRDETGRISEWYGSLTMVEAAEPNAGTGSSAG